MVTITWGSVGRGSCQSDGLFVVRLHEHEAARSWVSVVQPRTSRLAAGEMGRGGDRTDTAADEIR